MTDSEFLDYLEACLKNKTVPSSEELLRWWGMNGWRQPPLHIMQQYFMDFGVSRIWDYRSLQQRKLVRRLTE